MEESKIDISEKETVCPDCSCDPCKCPPEEEAFDPRDNRYRWPEDRR